MFTESRIPHAEPYLLQGSLHTEFRIAVILRQKECGPDVPPFAIAVQVEPEFWIDCADTAEDAIRLAESLGLRVV